MKSKTLRQELAIESQKQKKVFVQFSEYRVSAATRHRFPFRVGLGRYLDIDLHKAGARAVLGKGDDHSTGFSL